MRADLHRAIAGIDHRQRLSRPAGGKLDVAVYGDDRAGFERIRGGACFRPDRLMNGDELGAVGKYAFHLQDRQHGGNAGHHVAGVKDSRAKRHQVGDAFAFARAFENFVGDDGDRLGMVELEPLGAAFARELGGGKW